MAQSILMAFDDHPEELAVVGKIIIAYGELESILLSIVSAVLNGDTHTAVRALFRLRSESQRLDVADAIVRPWLSQQKLEGQYTLALGALRHCKSIRNQYAHCTWVVDEGLRFADLEYAARSKGDKCEIILKPISLRLLKEQLNYFNYTEQLTLWVANEYNLKTGQKGEPRLRIPKRIPAPPLDSHLEAQSCR